MASRHGLLLTRASPKRVVAWARRGLVALDIARVGEWTLVAPASSADPPGAPYDDPAVMLLVRPIGRRLTPALAVCTHGDRAVFVAHRSRLRPRPEWLVWKPGSGLVRPGDLPVGGAGSLVSVAGTDPRSDGSRTVERLLRNPVGHAPTLLQEVLGALGLPGGMVVDGGCLADLAGARTVRPYAAHTRRFDAMNLEERRWREEIDGLGGS